MEKTQRLLEIHRVSFQRIYDSIMAEMQGPEPNLSDIQAELPLLDQKIGQINSLNEQLLDLLLDADCNEEDIDNEVAKADDLTSDRKDWIPFWSQFKRIHNDDEIEKEDKFKFLIQSTIPKSRARELVESFPPSAENYNIAIDSLVSRFGKEELLVEYYVRELLKLVLTNLKVKMSLSTLYDKLESQLRSLETLGVTSEKYAAMLFPLVESSLPEERLRVWQRSQNSYANEEFFNRSSIEKTYGVFEKEVEDEEKISMAVSGFDVKSKTTEKPKETSIPTASGLINQQKSPVCVKCVFCKGSHRSEDCKEAQKMTLTEKKKILSSRGCCHSCLKFGHIARRCRVNIQCNNCKNRHSTLMCNKEESSEGTGKSKQNENGSSLTVDNLSNNTSSQVFLQTLLVELRSDICTKCVRAIIDTGSQRSYINKFIADEMGYESLREETLIHALFGGSESEVVKHSEYRIQVGNLNKKYVCNFNVLDQPVICSNLSTILCECEALMNSRPLTYVSENTNDLVPLTPSMFLHDLKEVGVPDIDNIDGNCLNRHVRYRIHLKEELTRRFRSEYLSQLIIRSKNHFKSEIKVGDVVIIGSDALKRLDWPLGVVTEVFPGKDSAIRVRLYPLEINTGEDYHEIKEKIHKQKRTTKSQKNQERNETVVEMENGLPPLMTRCGRTVKKPDRYQAMF
ncbi:hypothetical protein NQ317_005384 [Molorchus minor]|uniref:DUF5641 domain-containing protein n=1 Tax=Molorchus minor TaxID=1323400 RepID=A0ABQ9ISV1_9CUCU|nr:hypothetical protein NQ317_005384 [Molorchus minor]